MPRCLLPALGQPDPAGEASSSPVQQQALLGAGPGFWVREELTSSSGPVLGQLPGWKE